MRGVVVVDGQEAKIQRDAGDIYGDLSYGGSLELVLRNRSMVMLGSFDYFDSFSSDVTVNGQTNAATDLTGGDYDFDTDAFLNLLTVPAMAEGQTIVTVTVTDFFGKTTS